MGWTQQEIDPQNDSMGLGHINDVRTPLARD